MSRFVSIIIKWLNSLLPYFKICIIYNQLMIQFITIFQDLYQSSSSDEIVYYHISIFVSIVFRWWYSILPYFNIGINCNQVMIPWYIGCFKLRKTTEDTLLIDLWNCTLIFWFVDCWFSQFFVDVDFPKKYYCWCWQIG